MKTDIETIIKNQIHGQDLAFLAGTYPTNRFGGSDGDYLAMALDDQGRVHRFAGAGDNLKSEIVKTATSALATWRKIVDDPWHGFESCWETTERFLMDIGRRSSEEPQEAQEWEPAGTQDHQAAVEASCRRQGVRIVLGTDAGAYYEALAVDQDGQAYLVASTTDGGALSTRLDPREAFSTWQRILEAGDFQSRNDGVEAFLIGQGRKSAALMKAA
ncbi:MAG: hypothetical protein JNN07_27420 [Verrucomicrobiales bacterium]|nr:hypothetical protein [Verrucomicrobiales bacterium]